MEKSTANDTLTPSVIHQIWLGNKPLPTLFKKYAQTWRKHHPNWQYFLWKENQCECIIHEYFPQYFKQFMSLPHDIQRVDLLKYIILYCKGGLYVDLDYECLKPVNSLLKKPISIGLEPDHYANFHGYKKFLGNAFMASEKKQVFFNDLIIDIFEKTKSSGQEGSIYNDVMQSTGPIALNNFFSKKLKSNINLISSSKIAPLTSDEAEVYRVFKNKFLNNPYITNAFAIHHFTGTWLK